MAHYNFHFLRVAQVLCQLFGQIDRAMLASGATERHHQMLEAALPIGAHAFINQRVYAGDEPMHALLAIEILDDCRVFAGESFKAFFPSRIRKAAAIENKTSAVSGIVLRKAAVKGKTEDPHG